MKFEDMFDRKTLTDRVIDNAEIDDYDLDIGTSGLCAMFALALYRVMIRHSPKLVLVGMERDGKPALARDGNMCWSHAAVLVEGEYYDIEGRQKPEWLKNNYVWMVKEKAMLYEMTPEGFIHEIKTTSTARDRSYYVKWRDALTASYERITADQGQRANVSEPPSL